MTPKEIKYYEELNDMFMTDGWKNFKEEINNSVRLVNTVEQTKDVEDLFFRKGQLAVLAYFLNFETQVDVLLTNEAEENEAA